MHLRLAEDQRHAILACGWTAICKWPFQSLESQAVGVVSGTIFVGVRTDLLNITHAADTPDKSNVQTDATFFQN